MPYPRINVFHKSLEGASQAFLLRATNRQSYAVKFVEKAQSGRMGLAREYVAGQLGLLLQGPIPRSQVLELTQEFLDAEARLTFSDGTRPATGSAIGSEYHPRMTEPPDAWDARLDLVPTTDLAGVVVFNTWTAAQDRGEQNYSVYWEPNGNLRFAAIDFAESMASVAGIADPEPIRSRALADWISIESWVVRVEAIADEDIRRMVAGVPDEWLSDQERQQVVLRMVGNRSEVRARFEEVRP